MTEIWKTIPGLPKHFRASNLGRVKRIAHVSLTPRGTMRLKEKTFSGSKNKNGYLRVHLRPKHYWMHRLVLLAFIKQPKDKNQANHINGIKTDNALRNLEWVNVKENEEHARRTGLKKADGENNPAHKLMNHEVLAISRRLELGEKERDLAKEFKVHTITIHRIKTNKAWQKLLNN